jgi:hypothetical protein
MTDRPVITETVLALIQPEYTQEDVHKAEATWWTSWTTAHRRGGFGLTELGNSKFVLAELESYTFHLDKAMPSLLVYALEIDRKMICPYFLRYIKQDRYITVYDSRVAVTIQLHGNFSSYLNNLEDFRF